MLNAPIKITNPGGSPSYGRITAPAPSDLVRLHPNALTASLAEGWTFWVVTFTTPPRQTRPIDKTGSTSIIGLRAGAVFVPGTTSYGAVMTKAPAWL